MDRLKATILESMLLAWVITSPRLCRWNPHPLAFCSLCTLSLSGNIEVCVIRKELCLACWEEDLTQVRVQHPPSPLLCGDVNSQQASGYGAFCIADPAYKVKTGADWLAVDLNLWVITPLANLYLQRNIYITIRNSSKTTVIK